MKTETRLISFLVLAVSILILAATAARAKNIVVPDEVQSVGKALELAQPTDTIIILANYDSQVAREVFPLTISQEGLTISCVDAVIAVSRGPMGGATGIIVDADNATIEGCWIRDAGTALEMRGGNTVIQHNVITSSASTLDGTVAIRLEPEASGALIKENLITNEDIEQGQRGRLQPGKITTGIVTLAPGVSIISNYFGFLNIGVVLPAATDYLYLRKTYLANNLFYRAGIGVDVRFYPRNELVVIERNLFVKNVSGSVVIDRDEIVSSAVVTIEIDFNDFIDGFSVISPGVRVGVTIDASNNYAYSSPTSGKGVEPPIVDEMFCEQNFPNKLPPFPYLDSLSRMVKLPPEYSPNCEDYLPSLPPYHFPFPYPPLPLPTPGPRDLDKDGLYEDFNGNGRLDFDDAVQLALHIDKIANEDVKFYDFNANGRVDFDDAVRLAFKVGGQAATQKLTEMFRPSQLKISTIQAFPNPAKAARPIRFQVGGQAIKSINLQIFNLAGQRVFDSGQVQGATFEWYLNNQDGQVLANGVYLYLIIVRGYGGQILRSQVKKLVVLR